MKNSIAYFAFLTLSHFINMGCILDPPEENNNCYFQYYVYISSPNDADLQGSALVSLLACMEKRKGR